MRERNYRVRFNLSPGPNFMKWVVVTGEDIPANKKFYSPTECSIFMTDCILKNYPKRAIKIFDGADKQVCAWIECKSATVILPIEKCESSSDILYNPRIAPYWRNSLNTNIDNAHFQSVVSCDRFLQVDRDVSELKAFSGLGNTVVSGK